MPDTITPETHPHLWTASEAAKVLAPHLSPRQARQFIRVAGLEPEGYRHSTSRTGRKAAVYPAETLIRLFGVLEDLAPVS